MSFDWHYETLDLLPGFDVWGFLLNDSFTQLSDDFGDFTQVGSESFPVMAGDVFGFRIDCDANGGGCIFGAATVTVDNFSAPVPEPATLGLLGLGLASLGLTRRRRRR